MEFKPAQRRREKLRISIAGHSGSGEIYFALVVEGGSMKGGIQSQISYVGQKVVERQGDDTCSKVSDSSQEE